ncbi:MAG: Fe-S cluster assembly protein SufD [Muribaculaceae bacterium]|nr:Fe-S cluster assembly protein SufD [Muribaculaceae bacterium]
MKQYIDFYNSQRSTIEANSATILNKLRKEALDVVSSSQLPKIGGENYEITDLNSIFSPDYGINAKRIDMPVDAALAFRCDVPNMSTWLYFLFNDTFHAGKASGIQLPEGVIIDSLNKVANEQPKLVEKFYGKTATIKNPQVALNTLLAQDGIFIYIPDNTILERPIQLVNILNSQVPLMVNRRLLIAVGDNVQAKLLICDHTQNTSLNYLNNQVIEVSVGRNSTFDLYDLEESSNRTSRVSSLFASQDEGSNLLINSITLLNGITRNDFAIEVNGTNCETHLNGMAIANEQQHIDNHTFISHNTSRCTSNELFKYILDNEAKGAFTGRILVKQGADKIEAYQSNKNLIASDKAKMHTKPQLEIYNDDVKCSHGATIGQLDQNALFYMRTRGISEKEASMLLMQAFMNDIINSVRMDALSDRLKHLVEKRLSGELTLCGDCGAKCPKQ